MAWLCLYKVEIAAKYYYANNGPYDPTVITVLDSRDGFVRYAVKYEDGTEIVTWTSISTFALMCRKHSK